MQYTKDGYFPHSLDDAPLDSCSCLDRGYRGYVKEHFFRGAGESRSLGSAVINGDLTIRCISDRGRGYLGIDRHTNLLGRHMFDVVPSTKGSYVEDLHLAVCRTRKEMKVIVPALVAPIIVEVTGRYVEGGVAINVRNVTSDAVRSHCIFDLYKNLFSQTQKDELTGILHRSGFLGRIEHLKNIAVLRGKICVDIRNLKQITDSFGNPIGDAILCETAKRIVMNCGSWSSTVVGRIGSSQFMVAIFESPSTATLDLNKLSNVIHSTTSAPIRIVHEKHEVSVNIVIEPT